MKIKYELMTQADCPEVAILLQANAESQQGGLLGEYPLPKVGAMYANSLSTFVARDAEKIIGVVFSFASTSTAFPPIAHLILEQNSGLMNGNWFYGPVCIDINYRGNNILKSLYDNICAFNTGKPVAFINAANHRSLAAHLKIGMHNVASFDFQGTHYYLVIGN
ncbi:N-acetyltransferase [Providencia rettgeri]|nr:N-acetyltransferase [Providencia rettgeri]